MGQKKDTFDYLPQGLVLHNVAPIPGIQGMRKDFPNREIWYAHLKKYLKDKQCPICVWLEQHPIWNFDARKALAEVEKDLGVVTRPLWGRWR